MHLSTAILGKGIVEQLNSRMSAPVLTIGADTFTRPQLGKIGCFNFHAAARLTYLINEIGAKNTEDLFNNVPPGRLAVPGLGSISLATLGAAFEAMKIGTLTDYIDHHRPENTGVVSFATMKHNLLDTQAATRERKDAKNRKASRNNRAHEIRVNRHLERNAAGNN